MGFGYFRFGYPLPDTLNLGSSESPEVSLQDVDKPREDPELTLPSGWASFAPSSGLELIDDALRKSTCLALSPKGGAV